MTTEQLLREALVLHVDQKKGNSLHRAQERVVYLKSIIPKWFVRTNGRLAKLPSHRRVIYEAAFLHAALQLNHQFRELIDDELLDPAQAALLRRIKVMIDGEMTKLENQNTAG